MLFYDKGRNHHSHQCSGSVPVCCSKDLKYGHFYEKILGFYRALLKELSQVA